MMFLSFLLFSISINFIYCGCLYTKSQPLSYFSNSNTLMNPSFAIEFWAKLFPSTCTASSFCTLFETPGRHLALYVENGNFVLKAGQTASQQTLISSSTIDHQNNNATYNVEAGLRQWFYFTSKLLSMF